MDLLSNHGLVLRSSLKSIAAFLVVCIVAFSNVHAVEFSGTVSNDWYVLDDSGEVLIRPFIGLRSTVRLMQTNTGGSLSLHGNGRWRSELGNSGQTITETRIYSGYLQYSGQGVFSEFSLGRQFVYNPAGSAVLDGLNIRIRPMRSLRIRVFGGSATNGLALDKSYSLSDNLLTGASLYYDTQKSATLGLHWWYRKREGRAVSNSISTDFFYRFRQTDWQAVTVYDIISATLTKMRLRGTYRDSRWYGSIEYTNRAPSISINSIFSIIEYYRINELRLTAERAVYRRIRLTGQVFVGKINDEYSNVFSFGFSGPHFRILWRHYQGFGTSDNGIVAHANASVNRRLLVFITANLSRYRVQEEQDGRNDNMAVMSGMDWRLTFVRIRLEGQYLRNAVKDEDWRFLLRLSKYIYSGGRR